MGKEFKGTIKVALDEMSLSARLRFSPDDKGETHNADTLRQILQNENVVHGLNDVALKDAAELFSEATEETLSEPVAEGEEPTAGKGEVYTFSPMSYSPDLEKVVIKIRTMNKPPLIHRTMKTVVQKDRRVRDKGLFKGGKEKIVTVEEEVEKKIRVDVSSEIREIGYFETGDIICAVEISTGTEASGKDVHGKELQPPAVSKQEYLPGKNIRKEKNEFIAEKTGFVRVGESWMDLVPFETHAWSVRISDNKADCFLNITAGHKAAPMLQVSAVLDAVEKTGYPLENLLLNEKIGRIIRKGCQTEGSHSFCLTKDKDSEFNIEINSLATEANLHLKKGSGKGSKLDLKKAWAKVKDLKILNFDAERVKKEILDFHSSDQFEVSILLARGEDPQRGKDRELLLDTEYINESEMNFILERMEHLRKTPESFSEFPKEAIQKMALVKKGTVIFHLGKQSEGKNGRDIFGKTIQGIEGNDPIVRMYENILIQEGKAVSAIDGILDYSQQDVTYSLRVRKHTDSRIIVSVAENRMAASISVIPPEGSGCLPTKDSLKAALEEKGVVKGIKEELLNLILEKTGKEELVTDQIVAEGKVPFQGGDALKFLVDIEPGKKSTIAVDTGDAIAQITGQDQDETVGYDVLGEQMFGETDFDLQIDDNIKSEEREGVRYLVAGDKGLLCLEEKRLFIKSKQVIQGDVSRTIGNVKFPGTIEILGSVLSGIFVKAGNDLKVRDVVEASLLSSHGSILIGKGVKGDRKAVLRANRNINLGFAENSNLMSNGDIGYKKALMNCQIKCNGKILSQAEGSRIIGGKIKVKNGLTANTIGSERGGATVISFGQDYLVEDQINVMDKEIEKISEQLEALEGMMKTAEHKGQQKKLMSLRKKKVQLLKVQENKVVKNFLLKDKFELHFDSEIKITGSVYPGTVFESHGRKLEINENLTSIVVFFDSNTGRIQTKQI